MLRGFDSKVRSTIKIKSVITLLQENIHGNNKDYKKKRRLGSAWLL